MDSAARTGIVISATDEAVYASEHVTDARILGLDVACPARDISMPGLRESLHHQRHEVHRGIRKDALKMTHKMHNRPGCSPTRF